MANLYRVHYQLVDERGRQLGPGHYGDNKAGTPGLAIKRVLERAGERRSTLNPPAVYMAPLKIGKSESLRVEVVRLR